MAISNFYSFLLDRKRASEKDISIETLEIGEPTRDTESKVAEYLGEPSSFYPDSTINEKFILHTPESFYPFFTNLTEISYLERFRFSPGLLFLNSKKNEYLFAYIYEGSTKLSFSYFEIGEVDSLAYFTALPHFQTEEKSFITVSGLRLGLSLIEFSSIKGNEF